MPAKLSSRNDLALSVTVLRWLKGWDQEELAAASGVSFSGIQAIEQGRRKQPSLRTLGPLAVALGVDLSTLAEVVSLIRRVREGMQAPSADHRAPPVGPAAALRSVGAPALRREVTSVLLAQLEHGFRRAVPEREEARRQASALWWRLEGCSDAGRLALVRELGDFHTTEFCELLCDESLRAAADSAERAIGLAELAVEVAEKIAGQEGWRVRLKGYCGVHLANALRVRGDDLLAAEQVFARALQVWQAGAAEDSGPFNAARVLHLQASLARREGGGLQAAGSDDDRAAIGGESQGAHGRNAAGDERFVIVGSGDGPGEPHRRAQSAPSGRARSRRPRHEQSIRGTPSS
jgi:transcriptional regulator with XRE-family HTH domain